MVVRKGLGEPVGIGSGRDEPLVLPRCIAVGGAYDARETLPILLENAHPQQLTDSILRIVADDQQEPDFAGGLHSIPTGQV
ncbi:hypothetical protein BV881_23975 [Streptomyces sp. ZL-24]|uniref:hypothetical protein n=1 Tax=Streptomyces sp. ZL-24 TaxID=1933029 RepID=UPI000CD414C8|nr:hypothetical protein [Streptomyces sp. ZL-24]POG44908.1 hypothetical protein BV881_23975 [Streptomyces sp. ZL-24]